MTSYRNSIKITGGTFQGNAIGIGHTEQLGDTIGATAGIDELRARISAQSDEIVALGRDEDQRAELRDELRRIQQELSAATPDGSAVKSRWKAVLAVLDAALAASTKIAGITALVRDIFNG